MKIKARIKAHNLGYSGNGNHENWMIQFSVPRKYGGGSAVLVVSDGHGLEKWNSFQTGIVHRLVDSEGMDLDYDSRLDGLDDLISNEIDIQDPSDIDGVIRVIGEVLSRE